VVNCGDKFGRWEVVREIEKDKNGQRRFICQCDCGTERSVPMAGLRSRKSNSCGCYKSEATSARMKKAKTTHGHTVNQKPSPEYVTWQGIKKRCLNPNDSEYVNYGAIGITVCDRWVTSFERFLEDVGFRPQDKTSLDRIDNYRGYEPGNVRWATCIEQNRNRRRHRHLTINGEVALACEWADRLGIKRATLYARLRKGWADEEAVSIPIGERRGKSQRST
jgi:hypothetical protein